MGATRSPSAALLTAVVCLLLPSGTVLTTTAPPPTGVTGSPPPTTSTVSGVCPQTGPGSWHPSGEYCYQLVTAHQYSWFYSRYICFMMGGSLASVHSKEEMDFVVSLFTTAVSHVADPFANVWIGLYRSLTGGFVWVDDTEWEYGNWDDREPSNNNYSLRQKCAQADHSSGKWKEVDCIRTNYYVCKTLQVAKTTVHYGTVPVITTPKTTVHSGTVPVITTPKTTVHSGTVPVVTTPKTTAGTGGPPPTTSTVSGVCPQTGPGSWHPSGEYCYQLVTAHQYSWSQSRYTCSVMGGSLASVHSKEEMDFVVSLFTTTVSHGAIPFTNVWIGLYKGFTGGFVWVDGTEREYDNWDDGEPSDNYYRLYQKCVQVDHSSGKWKEVHCVHINHYVCKTLQVAKTTVHYGTVPVVTTPKTTAGTGGDSGGSIKSLPGGAVDGIVLGTAAIVAIAAVAVFLLRGRIALLLQRGPQLSSGDFDNVLNSNGTEESNGSSSVSLGSQLGSNESNC